MCFLSHSTQLENVKKHGEKVSGISYLQQVCVDMIMDILQLKQDEIEWKKELKDDPLQSDVHVCKKLKLHRNGETVNIASIFEQSLHIINSYCTAISITLLCLHNIHLCNSTLPLNEYTCMYLTILILCVYNTCI